MLVPAHAPEVPELQPSRIEDYEPLVGEDTVERILSKAEGLRDLHIVNISSTYYGGGVAEILSSLALLMNAVGIKTGWRVIQGRPDFFSITKKMHNALPGARALLQDSALLIDIKPVSTRTAIIRQQPRWEVLPCRRSSC